MTQISIPYLVLPPLSLVFFVAVMALLDAVKFDGKGHGWPMFWLPAAFAISLVVAFVMELYFVPKSAYVLFMQVELRSFKNYAAVGFAALYLFVVALFGYLGNRV